MFMTQLDNDNQYMLYILPVFLTSYVFDSPVGMTPHWNFIKIFGIKKLYSMGYCGSLCDMFSSFDRTPTCDTQRGGQKGIQRAIAYTMVPWNHAVKVASTHSSWMVHSFCTSVSHTEIINQTI